MCEAGYYAGWLASSIMIGRAVSAVPWGWVSDRAGRVPVMVVGNAGISITALLFGFSTSLSAAIGARALMGLISGGLVGTAKVCVGELFPEAHQPRAMGMLGATWGVGILLGPVLGGWLTRPYGRLPGPLGSSELLRDFPYALPCIALSALSACSALITQLCVPESLPKRLVDAKAGGDSRGWGARDRGARGAADWPRASGTCGASGRSRYAQLERALPDDAERAPAVESAQLPAALRDADVLSTTPRRARAWYCERPFVASMCVYAAWSFASLMLDEVVALFALATLGFSAVEIGSASAFSGLPLIAFQLFVFPTVVRRLGARRALIAAGCVVAPVALAIPLSAELRGGARWALLVFGLVSKTCIQSAGFTTLFILTNNAVVQAHRGVANGVGTVVSAIAKALGPAVGGPLFDWSIEERHGAGSALWARVGHYCVFVFAALLCLLSAALTSCSPPSLDRRREAAAHGADAPLPAVPPPASRDDDAPRALQSSDGGEDKPARGALARRLRGGTLPLAAAAAVATWDEVELDHAHDGRRRTHASA